MRTFMIERIEKGGPGSGHWGHRGRPGLRGGSAPRKSGSGWHMFSGVSQRAGGKGWKSKYISSEGWLTEAAMELPIAKRARVMLHAAMLHASAYSRAEGQSYPAGHPMREVGALEGKNRAAWTMLQEKGVVTIDHETGQYSVTGTDKLAEEDIAVLGDILDRNVRISELAEEHGLRRVREIAPSSLQAQRGKVYDSLNPAQREIDARIGKYVERSNHIIRMAKQFRSRGRTQAADVSDAAARGLQMTARRLAALRDAGGRYEHGGVEIEDVTGRNKKPKSSRSGGGKTRSGGNRPAGKSGTGKGSRKGSGGGGKGKGGKSQGSGGSDSGDASQHVTLHPKVRKRVQQYAEKHGLKPAQRSDLLATMLELRAQELLRLSQYSDRHGLSDEQRDELVRLAGGFTEKPALSSSGR